MANPSFTPGWHDGPTFLATPRSSISFLALGILDYRVLGTNFKDYAVVFTQLEFGDEVFNTVSLYSKWGLARLLTLRLARDWGKEKGRDHSHTLVASQRLLLPAQVGQRWLATKPCSYSPNGARGWASCLNSRLSCRRTVSVASMGLGETQEALVHIRADQGGGGTSPAFLDLCLVTVRPVWTVSSTEACGWDPGNCYSTILTTGSLLLQSLVHTRSSR